MIVTLSPAKLLDFNSIVDIKKSSSPQFLRQTGELIEKLKQLSIDEISELMSVNYKQALVVYEQIQFFSTSRSPRKQSVFAYNGIAFKGLSIQSFSPDDIDYAQDHLIVLSGLYGALRPLDMIEPYRLEMQIKLSTDKGKDLYDFWGEMLTMYMIERLTRDDGIWVNLMSDEYSKVMNISKFPGNVNIIVPQFKEQTAKGYRQVVVHTKKARGMMANFILKNRITDPEYLKGFDIEGYTFSEHLTHGNKWMFIR